ncbi:MAG TPA: alcohol dehydrogenase catalytic domain-containing protein [Longimicrobium sp.]|nr:alcohol dehydrogenase catalytic domain-containing protein [Longimicrobium sp.]
MRAAIFHENGGPEVVRVEQVPQPVPGPGEVLVEVKAAALNHLDLWVRRGMPIETTMPHVGGSDAAGVVVEVGDGVSEARAGERVVVNPSLWDGTCEWCRRGEEPLCVAYRIFGEHTDGGFCEYVAVPASHAYPIPDAVPFEEAAALPISYGTAWRALQRARLRAGEDVLVIGASGGTAAAAVQLARMRGARVFALTKGAENVERLKALGADFVYDRAVEEDFSKAVFRDTGKRGVDVVVENVGAATWKGSVRALARGGRLVTYGATAGPTVEVDVRVLFWKQLELIGTTMSSRAEFEAMLQAVWGGGLRPVIDSVMPLDDACEAHARLEAGGQFGKIVLVP